jgi:hypothetical protein
MTDCGPDRDDVPRLQLRILISMSAKHVHRHRFQIKTANRLLKIVVIVVPFV